SFPSIKSGDDVVEWVKWYREKLDDCDIKNKLLKLADEAGGVNLATIPDEDDDDDENPTPGEPHTQGSKAKKSRATEIVDAALKHLDLWHTPEGIAYATVREKPHATWALRRKPARQFLDRLYYQLTSVAAGDDAIRTAICTLEGIAV